MITKEKYKQIVSLYGKTSSFAIWGKYVSDLSVFEDKNEPWKKVNDKYVIVALNPACELKVPFENFHSSNGKHGDERLMNALIDTKLEGAFMTDLSGIKSPDSSVISISEKDVDLLLEKIKLLGDIKNVILFSSKCKELEKWFKQRGLRIFRLLHYSKQNGNAVKKFCLKNNIVGIDGNDKYIKAVRMQIERIDDNE